MSHEAWLFYALRVLRISVKNTPLTLAFIGLPFEEEKRAFLELCKERTSRRMLRVVKS